MQRKRITTFPFSFPPRPWEMRRISALRQGEHGRFGVLIEPEAHLENRETSCVFFEIDVNTGSVTRQEMRIPSFVLFQMDLCYDKTKHVWVAIVRGNGSPGPLHVYEVAQEVGQPWTRLFDAHSLDPEYQTDLYLVACWQHGDAFPLLVSEADFALMHDAELRWTHWRNSSLAQPVYQSLGTAYAWLPYLAEEGCVLITGECFYDEPSAEPFGAKTGPGQWGFQSRFFTHDGTLRSCISLPEARFRVRHLKVAGDDFYRWLDFSFFAAPGPDFGDQQMRSCIVVAMMYDHTTLFEGIKQGLPAFQKRAENATQRGGVYCFNWQGEILAFQGEMVGEHMTVCSCGEQIIGAMFHDGVWQLWRWFPFQEILPDLRMTLSSDLERATVVAPETPQTEADAWFWCLEESARGVRITQRACQDLRLLQDIWCEGISLPDWTYSPRIREKRPQGIVAYQERLLVVGLSEDGHLHLFQFQ